jgi:hypothetical protein
MTTTTPHLLREQRVRARNAWERGAWRDRANAVQTRWCRCGHTKVFHDLYHYRADGELEECWPVHERRCETAARLCEVCEECSEYEETIS